MKADTDNTKYEEPGGCGTGCGTIVGLAAFVTFVGLISFVDSEQTEKGAGLEPKKEISDTINTYNQIKDSVCVYKAR